MKRSLLTFAIALAVFMSSILQPQSAFAKPDSDETMFQVALLQSLTLGDYHGSVSIRDLKKVGDTGIGTFDRLNGELIMLDGIVYQALSDGTIAIPSDDMTIPFSNVAFLDSDVSFTAKEISNVNALKKELNTEVKKLGENSFYIARIDGVFDSIVVRSEYAQNEPYKPLNVVLETDQTVFNYRKIKGTIVAIYFPNYMNGLNVPGWHFHFVSSDKKLGGHVLEVSSSEVSIQLDEKRAFKLVIPSEDVMFDKLNLAQNLEKEIKKVETNE